MLLQRAVVPFCISGNGRQSGIKISVRYPVRFFYALVRLGNARLFLLYGLFHARAGAIILKEVNIYGKETEQF